LPYPLYMVRLQNGVVQPLDVQQTLQIVDRLRSNTAKDCRTNDAVYDVPVALVDDDQDSDHYEEEVGDADECDSIVNDEEGEEDVEWLEIDDIHDSLSNTVPPTAR